MRKMVTTSGRQLQLLSEELYVMPKEGAVVIWPSTAAVETTVSRLKRLRGDWILLFSPLF